MKKVILAAIVLIIAFCFPFQRMQVLLQDKMCLLMGKTKVV